MMRVRNVVFALLPTVIILALAEIICGFISPKSSMFWDNPMMMQYPVERFDPNVTLEEVHFNAAPDRVVRYIPDPILWYCLYPRPVLPKTGKLILHFGDSSTWGWGLTDRRYAYPDVLTEFLPDSVYSINLGVPGYSSLQGFRYLELMVKEYHERVTAATFYFGNNDCVENGAPDKVRMESIGRKGFLMDVNYWLEEYSAFHRVLRGLVSKSQKQDNTQPRVPPDEYRENLQSMIDLCNQYGIKVVLVKPLVHWSWQPGHMTRLRSLEDDVKNKWVLKELSRAERLYQDGLSLAYSQDDRYQLSLEEAVEYDWIMSRIKRDWRNVLDEFPGEVNLIRLPDAFVENEYPGWFVDYCHPSARVHSFIAHDIARRLGY